MKALLTRRQRLGLTWGELSEESGVPLSTLYEWHRRFKGQASRTKRRHRFVAVQVTEARPSSGEPLEITLRSGHRIRVSPDIDAERLRRVVVVLESGC